MTKISILIPTTPDRTPFVVRLGEQFREQLGPPVRVSREGDPDGLYREIYKNGEVEILYLSTARQSDDNRVENSIGFKRNILLGLADGEYLDFIDSDDRIGPNYFKHAFEGIDRGVDVCGLTGIITEDGQNPKKFVHSMQYDSWFEKDGVYYRNNNHLNVIRSSIAKKMHFPETNMGEDHDYSKQLLRSGMIKTEYWEPETILYYYDYVSKK